jgi:hypothetical protein
MNGKSAALRPLRQFPVIAILRANWYETVDRERTVVTRFLPEAVPMGVFILDRYAALHTQWLLPRPDFPPVAEVADWLRVLDYQCKL